jgi:hypothetical protein
MAKIKADGKNLHLGHAEYGIVLDKANLQRGLAKVDFK